MKYINAEQVLSELDDDLVSNGRNNETPTIDFEFGEMTLTQLKEIEIKSRNYMSSHFCKY